MLARSDFVMSGFGVDAQLPQLHIDVLHKLHDARSYRSEILVFKLLSLGRSGAEQRSAGIYEILARVVKLFVYKEIFLLGSHGGLDALALHAEQIGQLRSHLADGAHRTEQRSFLIQNLTRVRNEAGRDIQRRTHDERVAGRIPRGVSARFRRFAHSSGREARRVGFALDELLALESHDDRAALLRVDEGIVLFGGKAGHGLEPVRIMRRAFFDRPVLHRFGDFVRERRRQRRVCGNRRFQRLVGFGRESFLHLPVTEDHAAEQFGYVDHDLCLL